MMASDIWFRADVARLLRATHEAMLSTANAPGVPADTELLAAYREGFCAALSALAAGFGLTESKTSQHILAARLQLHGLPAAASREVIVFDDCDQP